MFCFAPPRLWNGYLLILVLAGCGAADNSHQAITSVTGRITSKGAPVPYGHVNFVTDAGYGFSATAPLQEDGSFILQSSRGTGVPPGEYQVSVALPSGEEGEEESKATDYPLIPLKYQKIQTSGLRLIVEAEEANHFEIDMNP